MNILINWNSSNNSDTGHIFYRHVEGWSKLEQEIYFLSHDKPASLNFDSLNFIQKPGYVLNNYLLSLWFKYINHPRIDIVVNKFSYIPFSINKSNIVILFNSDNDKFNYLKKLCTRIFYKNSYFLVEKMSDRDLLIKTGVKLKKIFVLENSIFNYLGKRNVKRRFGKKILFIDDALSPDLLFTAIQIFEKVDRRQEDWKYKILATEENYENTREMVSRIETRYNFSVNIIKSDKHIVKEILRTDLLLQLSSTGSSIKNSIHALVAGIPVVAYKSPEFQNYQGIEKAILMPLKNDPEEVARLLMDFSVDAKLMNKVKKGLENCKSLYSWSNLTKQSLTFLESM